jgi:hypothetical protein
MTEPRLDTEPLDTSLATPMPLHGASSPSPWDGRGRHHSPARVFAFVGIVLALAAAAAVVAHVGWRKVLGPLAPQETTEQLHQRIADCSAERDFACLADAWREVVRRTPSDARAQANLGMALAERQDDAAAVPAFERAIELGEGTYDLFAYYADSLERVGRLDDAIEWSYKSLSVVPQLVDVRTHLAQRLVARDRRFEALSVLQAFDAYSVSQGHPPYFEGQRIAIESEIGRRGVTMDPPVGASGAAPTAGGGTAPRSLHLPAFMGHFYVPVRFGDETSTGFLVDTGSSVVAVPLKLLAESHARYRTTQPALHLRVADGRTVTVQGIVIESMRVGGVELHDVVGAACERCQPLLGQTALSHFDLQSSRTQGLEFLTMRPRTDAAAGGA